MFSIVDRRPARDCQGWTRREFLRIGALGVGSLSLAGLQRLQSQAGLNPRVLRQRSVVLLFLQGGPPHIELFDPKMTAPSEIRSVTGETPTKHPGVTFGGTFPKLASLADQFSIVRSYGSGNAGHTYGKVLSGGNPTEATISSIYARIRGTNHPVTGLPTNVLVLPEAVQSGLKLGRNFETSALPTLTQAGSLGATYSAFNPSGGGDLKQDMELSIAAERFTDRRALLGGLDQLRRGIDADGSIAGLDNYQQQAFEMIARGVAEAFDLSKEDPRILERYDTSGLFRQQELTRYYDMKRASNLLGRQMLLARRLCEAGCGFVTVSDCGWDYHANNNSPKNMAGVYPMGGQVDHAVSAFLEDVRERGLSDDILLVVTGEMGRTPRLNRNGGRDHYGELTSLLMAGGGVRPGQVIGSSDATASRASGDAFRPKHLLTTIMHTLFDVAQLRLEPNIPRELQRFAESATPIRGLI